MRQLVRVVLSIGFSLCAVLGFSQEQKLCQIPVTVESGITLKDIQLLQAKMLELKVLMARQQGVDPLIVIGSWVNGQETLPLDTYRTSVEFQFPPEANRLMILHRSADDRMTRLQMPKFDDPCWQQ